jgi:hypothetical protein
MMNSFSMLRVLLLLSLPLLTVSATTAEQDELVRSQCRAIIETQFPPNRFVTKADLEAYSKLFSTKYDTLFENPAGNSEKALRNPTPDQVMQWMDVNGFVPSDEFQYSSHITSPIIVTDKTCTFQRVFVGIVHGSCIMISNCYQVIQVDEDGKQVVFKDHWDENAFNKQLEDCYAQVEADRAKTGEEL